MTVSCGLCLGQADLGPYRLIRVVRLCIWLVAILNGPCQSEGGDPEDNSKGMKYTGRKDSPTLQIKVTEGQVIVHLLATLE